MCRLISVSTSGYYDWYDRPPSIRAQENADLAPKIKGIHFHASISPFQLVVAFDSQWYSHFFVSVLSSSRAWIPEYQDILQFVLHHLLQNARPLDL